jgi:hypothetical protein
VDRALRLIEDRHGPARDIVLISDDLSGALERLGSLAARVTPHVGASAFADMAVLLSAKSLILCNSSFSWWAGWCGDAATIAYPARGAAFHYPAPAKRFAVV